MSPPEPRPDAAQPKSKVRKNLDTTTDTLTRLVEGWPQSRIDELMPWAYGKAEAP